MPLSSLTQSLILVAILGPATHYTLWVRIVVDDYVERLSILFLIFQPILIYTIHTITHLSWLSSCITSVLLQSTYTLTLLLSISIYRLYLHPLHSVPGPFYARLSVFWRISAFLESNTKCYLVFDTLHARYGDIVRLGPRQVSILNVDAISAIYGRASPATRGVNADLMRDKNIMCLRSKTDHARRRVAWDQALGSKACHAYLPRITALVDTWIVTIRKHDGKPINVTEWVQMLVFDISGDSGWGESYHQIENGKVHPAIEIMHRDLKAAVYGVQVAWLVNIVYLVPGFPDPSIPLKNHCIRMLKEHRGRRKVEGEKKDKEGVKDGVDVLSYLERAESSQYREEKTLISDLRMLTLGASDTSFSAIVFTLYHLAKYPHYQSLLFSELTSANITLSTAPDYSALSSLPFLDAIISETLRIRPPVPQGLLRELPPPPSPLHPNNPAHYKIGPYLLPAGTQLSVPVYTLHHSERYFARAEEFIPERFLAASHPDSKAELVKDRRAYLPFSVGPMACAGKYFAMMEMKVFVSRCVLAFEVGFPESDTDGNGEEDRLVEGISDCFTVMLPDFEMCFKPRVEEKGGRRS